ncbi:MAG TPA: cupin domain-containing protein [Gemmatimonadaceae bacterium]|nr:cupin domain-containing protein [Gemmatimonadaceae bacterium]
MKRLDPLRAAREAVAPNGTRPATAILHDSADARLVVFRLAPGQSVPPHRSASAVQLTVLEGTGLVAAEVDGAAVEQPVAVGAMVAYEPNELHWMRAVDQELLLLATITPRPGVR